MDKITRIRHENEKIAKASKTWEGVDVDKYIDEVRGREPDKGLDVTDFCKPIDPGIAQCVADHWWELLGDKEPDKSLEEEAEEWAENEAYGKSDAEFEMAYKGFIAGAKQQKEQDTRDMIMSDGSYFQKCYELGKKDAEKEINKELIKAMEKVHEIRDVDYDIHVDTSADGSFETISYYENGKLVGQELSNKED